MAIVGENVQAKANNRGRWEVRDICTLQISRFLSCIPCLGAPGVHSCWQAVKQATLQAAILLVGVSKEGVSQPERRSLSKHFSFPRPDRGLNSDRLVSTT